MSQDNKYSMLRDPEMKEIVDSFIVETKEILEKLDLNLIELENKPNDSDLLNEVFRSFHTIKGTSGFLGLDKLTQVTHRCEDFGCYFNLLENENPNWIPTHCTNCCLEEE